MSYIDGDRFQVDWDLFDKLCSLHCTEVEIASALKISVETLSARIKEKHGVGFREIFAVKSSSGKISLRRKQYELAMAGNTKMLDKLGDAWLGQGAAKQVGFTLSDDKSRLVIDFGDDDSNDSEANS